MSRYVEAETLVRWICGNKCGCERDECGYDIPCQQVQLLENAPSIDIVPCKECRHKYQEPWHNGVKVEGECEIWHNATLDDDFCSYGERSRR